MRCPKCGHERRAGETAPEWQCPSCGVAYAKVASGQNPVSIRREQAGSGKFARFVGLLLVVAAGIAFVSLARHQPPPPDAALQDASVIMYSLTTCGYCVQKRAQLRAEGIPFVEYFLDTDPERFKELTSKLTHAGFRGGGIGTPTFDVKGTMLPNNPSMATIRKHL